MAAIEGEGGGLVSKYFVISVSEDGIYVEAMTKEELERELQQEIEDYEGDGPQYLDALPEAGVDEWNRVLQTNERLKLIIKGKIVVPKPRQVVTRYEID
jgi:hypothetical protein